MVKTGNLRKLILILIFLWSLVTHDDLPQSCSEN